MTKALVRHQHAEQFHFITFSPQWRAAKGSISIWSRDPAISGFQTASDYVLGLRGEQVTEMSMDASSATSWQYTNVYANGELLATYDNLGLHFALNDWLGTKRVQASPAGAVELNCWNLPFNDGFGCSGPGSDSSNLHYTGKEHDPYTALDLFGAREYTNFSGRFLSPDWSASPTPVPYGNLGDPQSLNLYTYVRNNPLRGVDVDGHQDRISVGGDGWGTGSGWPAGVGYGRSMYNLLGRYNASLLAQAEEFDAENELIREPLRRAEEAIEPLDPNAKIVPEWPPANAIRPGEKGPLDPAHAKNFKWYVPWTPKEDTVFYRNWGDPATLSGRYGGSYASLFPPGGNIDFLREQFAIPPEWNSMENLREITVHAGDTVYVGPAAAQSGFPYGGGGLQVFIPNQ